MNFYFWHVVWVTAVADETQRISKTVFSQVVVDIHSGTWFWDALPIYPLSPTQKNVAKLVFEVYVASWIQCEGNISKSRHVTKFFRDVTHVDGWNLQYNLSPQKWFFCGPNSVYALGEVCHGQNATCLKTLVFQVVHEPTSWQQHDEVWFLRYVLCEVCRTRRRQKRDECVEI